MKKYSAELKSICKLQIAANDLLNWIFSRKSNHLNREPFFVFDVFRNQLAASFSLYPRGGRETAINLKKFTVSELGKTKVLGDLAKLFNENRKHFSHIVVQGSVADNTAIKNWSDLDIFAVVKESALESGDNFLRAREVALAAEKCLYEFDKFQHHGIQFVSEKDLKFYPEYFLPLEVLKNGKLLTGSGRLEFLARDSFEEKQNRFFLIIGLLKQSAKSGVLKHHAKNGIYLEESFKNKKDNFYQLKYFISVVLLLPSLFLELIDGPVCKKDSFEKIKKYFQPEDLELLDKCEKVRSECGNLKNIKNNEIPKEVMAVLGGNYLKRGARLANKLYEIYQSSPKT